MKIFQCVYCIDFILMMLDDTVSFLSRSFGSFFQLRSLLLGKSAVPFVLFSTIGNIISLCGSCFLSGPQNQLSKMWHHTRRCATELYVGLLVVTVIVMLVFEFLLKEKGEQTGRNQYALKQGILLVLLILCQYVAVAWYCLSYIPLARRLATIFLSGIYSDS